MVEGAIEHFPAYEREVNNMSSGIFNSFLGLGQVIGPMFGSILNEVINFQHTTTICAAIDLAFAIAYFFCAGGV